MRQSISVESPNRRREDSALAGPETEEQQMAIPTWTYLHGGKHPFVSTS